LGLILLLEVLRQKSAAALDTLSGEKGKLEILLGSLLEENGLWKENVV
jgi:hypothetical protein